MNKGAGFPRALIVLALVVLGLIVLQAKVCGLPPNPYSPWGTVTLNGSPAPNGTRVTAWIGGVQYASTTTNNGWYVINVPGDDPATSPKEGGLPGETVLFKVNDYLATPSGIWQSGVSERINLTANSPTAATLVSCRVSPGRGGVHIAWETGSEIGTVGFHIYRGTQKDGAVRRINEELIPSQATGSVGGASYVYLDTSARSGATYYYWLEEVAANSSTSERYYLGQGRWDMPMALRVFPAQGGRPALEGQRFNAQFKDAGRDLATVYLAIGEGPEAERAIVVRYEVATNALSLYDPQARQWLPNAAPGERTVRNTLYGSLRPAASQVRTGGDGEYLTVGWFLKFWARMRGEHSLYIRAVDAAGNDSGWKLAGTWTVE